MGFHPERLTGRRARQWRKSVEWRPRPTNVPKTLVSLIRKPDLIRGWGRIKTEAGHFHYVVLVRDRLVAASHLIDRKAAANLARTFDVFGGDGDDLICKTCEQLYANWASVSELDIFESLPTDLQLAVRHRKISTCTEVIDKSMRKVSYSNRRASEVVTRRANPDGHEHPSKWTEPSNLAERWYKDRRFEQTGGDCLSRALQRLATKSILPHIQSVTDAGLVVTDQSRYHQKSKASAEIVWSQATDNFRVELKCNLFNWYVRAYKLQRLISGQWLILVPGKTEHYDDAVPCDALDLEEIKIQLVNSRKSINYMREANAGKIHKTELVTLELETTHGVLFKTTSGWSFTPTSPRSTNFVTQPEQLVPDVRAKLLAIPLAKPTK